MIPSETRVSLRWRLLILLVFSSRYLPKAMACLSCLGCVLGQWSSPRSFSAPCSVTVVRTHGGLRALPELFMEGGKDYNCVSVELDLFKSFVAVAEVRSFRRAALAMHIPQPTLSRQIARLEKELGTQLFERYGRHVECTYCGELLLPIAQSIISRTADAVNLMHEQAGASSGAVQFGATGEVFAHLLTPILTTFAAAYPSVRLGLAEWEDVELEDRVASGELDCAVITAWGSPRSIAKHLLTEEILLVVPRDHQLAARPAVSLGMIAKETLLLPRAWMNISSVVADAFRRAGIEPKASYQSNYAEFIKNLVRAGWGLAPMPKMLVAPETLEGLVTIPFQPPVVRSLVLIYQWDRPLSAPARALMAHIQREVFRIGSECTKPRVVPDRTRRPRAKIAGL